MSLTNVINVISVNNVNNFEQVYDTNVDTRQEGPVRNAGGCLC